jgi:hypothetical protein
VNIIPQIDMGLMAQPTLKGQGFVRAGFARVWAANRSRWAQTCPDGYFLGQKSPNAYT